MVCYDKNNSQELSEKKEDLPLNTERRKFLLTLLWIISGIGVLHALKPFIFSWFPSAKTKATGATLRVDLRNIQPGEQLIVEWRGKPVWIIRRTQDMLNQLRYSTEKLRDPLSLVDQQPDYAKNEYRSIHPEYLVLVGFCTHLGCSPQYKPLLGEVNLEWKGGFFCPCHGSAFDLAGRVFKGMPAPINMEVPPYRFINDHTLIVGDAE